MEEFLSRNYQAMGDFFTGATRRGLFWASVISILILILAIQYIHPFKIQEDTLYWIFSSVVQSLMALVGFMGVLVVFKYQQMGTREDRLLQELNRHDSDLAVLGGDLTATSSEELLENLERHTPEPPGDKDGFRTIKLRRVKQELKSYSFLRGFLGNYLLKFAIFAFTIILFNLLALSFVPLLALYPQSGVIILYMTIILVGNTLRMVIKIIGEITQ